MKISGFIARPCISRGNRSFEGYYVNHRYIKSAVLTKAIEDAFRTFVMIHKFPFTEINFDVKPDLIDVNVHPTKMELKFVNSQDIYSFTYNAIRETLLFKELIPDVTPGKDPKPETFKQRDLGDKPEAFENNRREALVAEENKNVPTNVAAPMNNTVPTSGITPTNNSAPTSSFTPVNNSVPAGSPLPESTPAPVRPVIEVIDETKSANFVREDVSPYKRSVSENRENVAESNTDNQNADNQNAGNQNIDSQNTCNRENVNTNTDVSTSQSSDNQALLNNSLENIKPAEEKKKYVQQDMFQEKFLTKEARAKHRLIGQLFKTYWLIEYDGRFFIMDQHAAHEKVKYEELMANYNNKKIYSQYLMPPAVVTLSAAEIEFLHENMEMFEALGYQIENFGGREFKLNAVPDNLFGLDGRELFIDFIADASSSAKKVTIDTFIHKLSTMACKAAIKGNTEISFKEADALIDQLLKLENPYTCPHGRPTVISMTEAEIEKKFKRIV